MSSIQEIAQLIQEKEQMLMNLAIKATNEIADLLEDNKMERFNLLNQEGDFEIEFKRLRDEKVRLVNEGLKNDEKCADISKELKLLYAQRFEMSQSSVDFNLKNP